MLKNKNIDLVYVNHITMAQLISNQFKVKIVYDELDIYYLNYFRYALDEKNFIKKMFFLLESIKLKNFEKKFLPRFSHIFSISRLDKKRLVDIDAKPEKTSFLPVPFKIHNCYESNHKSPVISFIGRLSWRPNKKSILWFIEKIFPILRQEIPNIRLTIAGTNKEVIKAYIRKLKYKNNSINYLGYVKNLATLYKKTSAVIIPITMGSGIRIKLLDAMSHGMPIVSTALGTEGIEVRHNEELLIADTPEDFAQAVIRIINDKELALRLSKNGMNFIKKYYNEKETEKALYIINKI